MSTPAPRPFSTGDIRAALGVGWRVFRRIPGPSVTFAAVFALIGLALLAAVDASGVSPLILPLAGGFMLVGPAVLAGFFALFRLDARGDPVQATGALAGFTSAPAGLWLIAAVCAFLFVIWITDAGVFYSFMVGGEHLPIELPWLIRLHQRVVVFELWAGVMGSALALIIFAISAFSVPLLFERRADPVGAVNASVRAVFGSPFAALLWGLLLAAATIAAILLLPLLVVVLPVLAYASFALYQRVFPTND